MALTVPITADGFAASHGPWCDNTAGLFPPPPRCTDCDEDHHHEWGPIEVAPFTGTPHRKCSCGWVSLDLDDDEPEEDA